MDAGNGAERTIGNETNSRAPTFVGVEIAYHGSDVVQALDGHVVLVAYLQLLIGSQEPLLNLD